MAGRSRGVALEEAFEQLLSGIEEFQGTLTPAKRKPQADLPSLRPPVLRAPKTVAAKKPVQCEVQCSKEDSPVTVSPDLQAGWLLGEDQRFSPVLPQERSPRFPTAPVHYPCIRQLSPEEHQQFLSRLRLYRQSLSQYTPQERLKSMRQRSTQVSTRLSISKAARTEIEHVRKRHFEAEMEVKQRRFRWRQFPAEICAGKRLWAGLALALSLVERWTRKAQGRRVRTTQELHIRSQRTLMLFLVTARICGKALLKAKKMRFCRLLQRLRPLRPYIRHWKANRRGKFIELVTDFLENSISRDVIYRLVTVWKQRVPSTQIITIQRGVKDWQSTKEAQKTLLLLQWERWEDQFPKGLGVKQAPKRVKELLLSDILKRKGMEHVKNIEKWQETCRNLQKARKKAVKADPLAEFPVLKLPPRPRFLLFLSPDELQTAQKAAEKKKSRWDRMAKPVRRKGY